MQHTTKNTHLTAELKVSYGTKTTGIRLDSVDLVADYLRKIWDTPMIPLQEQFYALFLNNQNELIGWRMISTGTSNQCLVDVKLLCALALQSMCSKVVLAHNHPSGSLKPSKKDIALTWQIQSTFKMFDIIILDHVIITENFYYSFVAQNMMDDLFSHFDN